MFVEANSTNANNLIKWIERFIIEEDVQISHSRKRSILSIFSQTGESIKFKEFDSILIDQVVVREIEGVGILASRHKFLNGHECIKIMYEHNPDSYHNLKKFLSNNGVSQIDEDQFELYRIKNLIPVSGKEITLQFNPLELNLYNHIDFEKGCYVGQEVIARLDTYNKVQRTMKLIKKSEDSDLYNHKDCVVTSEFDDLAIGVIKNKILT